MAHTPGMWGIGFDGNGWQDADMVIVAQGLGMVCKIPRHLDGLYQGWNPTVCRTHEHQEANANLIAAAPDLLAALKLLRDPGGEGKWVCYCTDPEYAGRKCENCVATDAINKAEGRTA